MEKITLKTKPVRVSYPKLNEPVSFNGGTPKYSVSLIIDKGSETEQLIQAAIDKLADGLISRGNSPEDITSPLKNGSTEYKGQPEYEGKSYINASTQYAPSLVHNKKRDGKLIEATPEEIYAGSYAIASLTLYAYDNNGYIGVGCGFNGLMKTKDGERLDGKESAEAIFADIDVEEIDDEGLLD